MATRNIVPRATGEGSLGTSAKHWGNIYADNGTIAGRNIANDGAMLANLQNQVTTLEHAYAGAKAATTVADMTDHNQIYVYVGSESGYTNGNWYYWNGTAWTSGGVYQATALETDKTLTVSGAAADAKVVGDLCGKISETITDVETGHYIASTGVMSIASDSDATNFIPVTPGFAYKFSNIFVKGSRAICGYENANSSSFVACFATGDASLSEITITIPNNVHYIRGTSATGTSIVMTIQHTFEFLNYKVENIGNTVNINISADMTNRLLIDGYSQNQTVVINGNGHTIDLGEDLTSVAVRNGNVITIPYTAASNSYYDKCFIQHTLSLKAIRPGVYNAILTMLDGTAYKRMTPLATATEVNNTDNSFTYNGSNIIIHYSGTYNKIIVSQNSFSCLDIRAGQNVIVKDLILKNSLAGNFVCVEESSNVELYNCESYNSGLFDGFRFDYGKAKIVNCISNYNGRDGFNFNHANISETINCEGCHNHDDGISHHEVGTNFVIDGGIFDHNGKGGISSPVLGAAGIAVNCISRNNTYGIYTYETAKGFYTNIVMENNTHRVLNHNHAYLINCKSANNGADDSTATLEEW